MLVTLLNAPRTAEEWAIWSFAHRDSHARIREAIQEKMAVNLTDYQLDPISQNDVQGFLQRNSQSHSDMLGVLGIQSEDLLDVDFKDQKQTQAWVWLHYNDHLNAETALGI